MNCTWQGFLNLVPIWMREEVDRLGKFDLQELRLRLGRPPELVRKTEYNWLDGKTRQEDLEFTINIASQYSAWAATAIRNGYLTAPGGHRVGICGEVSSVNGTMTSISRITSLCLRVARDFSGISNGLSKLKGSLLIVGSPGCGKTTLLRDAIRCISAETQRNIAVVDERMEIFPVYNGEFCFAPGERTDVLSGCSKVCGIEMLLRTMTPHVIAVDEITCDEDAQSLLRASRCGVDLIATAHASGMEDLRIRQTYKPLLQENLFQHVVIMGADKSWTYERMIQ
jgi:stage III sporulation protein AA